MKKLNFYLMLCSIFMTAVTYSSSGTDFTTITGYFNFDPEIEEITLHSVDDGERVVYATTKLNNEGQFGFVVPVTEPGFYYIDYGQMRNNRKDQLLRLYLEPGLQIEMAIEEKDYTLSGEELGYNRLVQEANEIYDQFALYTTLGARVTYEDFFPFVENKGVEMVREFKSSIDTKDKEFNKLLELAVTADFEHALYEFFRFPRTKHPEKNNRPAIYKEIYEKGAKFLDPNILKLGNGLAWMQNYFFYQGMRNGFKKAPTERLSNAITHISDNTLKEVYIREDIRSGRYKIAEYKVVIEPLYKYLTSEESKAFVIEYEKELHKNEGQPGFNFTYNDINGNPVSFSDFKGKYVYLDVWATWCGPCKKEIPFLKELEHDFKDEDIVFMSVSVDEPEDKQKWKDFVKEEQLGGVQLMADKAFRSGLTQNYDINAIPRFLLFDKEGKIISTDALRPSNPLLRENLEDLLSQPGS